MSNARRPTFGHDVSPEQLRDGIVAGLEASDLRAEIARLRQELEEATKQRDALLEALTPSGDTKSAYIGDFSWVEVCDDADYQKTFIVPWTTIKDIMEAIRARAFLARQGGGK